MKNNLIKLATLSFLAASVIAPVTASAADFRDRDHREDTRNTWTGLTIGSALVGIAGLANGDKNVAAAGAAGAIYSLFRLSTDHRDCDHYGYFREPVRAEHFRWAPERSYHSHYRRSW